MKWSTPRWLFNKYWNRILDRVAPTKLIEVDHLKFRYPRTDPPPESQQLSSRGLEFFRKIETLSGVVAIDAGANIGSYSLRLAKKFERVFAFEPNPQYARILKANVALNLCNNIEVEELALADHTATSMLYVRGGATSLDPSHYGMRYTARIPVRTVTLDDFALNMEGIDFLKVDAEGYESQIITGGLKMISLHKPVLAVEVHRSRIATSEGCGCDICAVLRRLGYAVEVTGEFNLVGDVHWTWATPIR